MEINIDFSGFEKQFDEKEIKKKIKRSVEAMGFECEAEAKRIVADNSVDTGQFLNSIWTKTWENGDEIGFTMHDGVDHGIYHEFGTISHFVPFYDKNDEPILADWAKRVLGMTEEEMQAQGGMMVEISESMPFRKALIHIENGAEKIFKKEFSE